MPLKNVGVVVCGGNADLAGLMEQMRLHLEELEMSK